MPGPRQVTIKGKDCKMTFKKLAEPNYRNTIDVLIEDGKERSLFGLTDADVRKLRNWLNWYLDNK